MKNSLMHPKWWLLYLSIACVLGLFWLEVKSSFSEAIHTWIEIGLVIILYGLVMIWLDANQKALFSEERQWRKQKLLLNTIDTPQTIQGDLPKQSGNNPSHDTGKQPGGQVWAGWLISLMGLISVFFKIQDK
jgi:hypothetical protein